MLEKRIENEYIKKIRYRFELDNRFELDIKRLENEYRKRLDNRYTL